MAIRESATKTAWELITIWAGQARTVVNPEHQEMFQTDAFYQK